MNPEEQWHQDTCDQQQQEEEFQRWVDAMEKKYGWRYDGKLKEERDEFNSR